MEKVTVIGFKNAGKTCYLAGMYDFMSYGAKNFSLVEKDSDQDWYLQKLWENISNGASREWPVPSDEKRVYTFSLQHNFQKVMEFEWLDYPGAALVDPGYGLIDELTGQISESACLLILVNGESFAFDGDPNNQIRIQAESDSAYKQIVAKNLKRNRDLEAIRQLSKLGSKGITLPPIGIVVTKSDLIEDQWIPYVQDIIIHHFSPIFGENSQDEHIVMLSAVTLGDDIQFGGDAEPVDIELPIAFAVLSILRKYVTAKRVLKAQNNNTLSQKDTLWCNLFNQKQLEDLRKAVAALDAEIGKMSQDAICLLDLFAEGKPIYINAQKQNFRKFFQNELR